MTVGRMKMTSSVFREVFERLFSNSFVTFDTESGTIKVRK
jgi:hypothetical protein